ncbi:MAG: hypothetical protein P8N45_01910, partial [Glaciecola sp.]|nr:hypothetical protein [Glaciecola sp.]
MHKLYLLTCIGIAFGASAHENQNGMENNIIENIVVIGANPLNQLSQTQSIIGQTQTLTSRDLHNT